MNIPKRIGFGSIIVILIGMLVTPCFAADLMEADLGSKLITEYKDVDYIKVVSLTNITESLVTPALADCDSKKHTIKSVSISSASVSKVKTSNKITVSVTATPRPSGGITAEFFCKDNTGRYMPVWGGSVTKAAHSWEFMDSDIKRTNIEGCYFAVVDSTNESVMS